MAGMVPVNLNFTAGKAAMESAVEQCGITTILTSRVFLAKAKIEAMEGMVFIEDVLKSGNKVTRVSDGSVCAEVHVEGGEDAGFAGYCDLFERIDGQSEGRDAVALQHPFEH